MEVLATQRAEFERLMSLYRGGALSGPLVVARLLLVCRDVGSVEAWLADRLGEAPCAGDLLRLIAQHRHGCERVAALVAFFDQHLASTDGDSEVEDVFDRAVELSGDASVALYCLGDAGLLERATSEIVERLNGWALLGTSRRTLEIGCGTGRMQAALSSNVELAAGVDVAPKMVERARKRCAGLQNTRHLVASGSDLREFEDASLDLVYAVDSFPYIVALDEEAQVTSTFAEVARVLAPGRDFVILNYSYRGDDSRDVSDVERHARRHGFEVAAVGERPFELWDGVVYRLRRCG